MDSPMDIQKDNELLNSPLQQLEFQAAKARSRSASNSPTHPNNSQQSQLQMSPSPAVSYPERDRDSIYSFDSVSTNGRLLDRLGLENDYPFEDDNARFERLSISDIGKLSRNGSVGFNYNETNPHFQSPPLQNPFRHASITQNQVSQPQMGRVPQYRSNSILRLRSDVPLSRQGSTSRENQPFMVKNVPSNIVHPSRNKSVDSLRAPLQAEQSLTPILSHAPVKGSPGVDYNEYDEFNFNSSSESISQEHPEGITKKGSSPTTPKVRGRSVSATTSTMSQTTPQTRRSISDYTASISPSTKMAELTPEDRTRLSSDLRSRGKDREASYQLQIAANSPFNYPRAMFLYAMALKYGQGVKQNYQSSIKWLCKSMLVGTNPQEEFVNRVNELKFEELLNLVVNQIKNDNSELDPIKLHDYYSQLLQTQIAKLVKSVKSQSEYIPLVYLEIASFFLNGWGVDKDEMLGIKCLGISSSMGNYRAMVDLGDIWGTKTKAHKKDNYKASAWLRLSETFGIRSIGNSWIYKDKYLEKRS